MTLSAISRTISIMSKFRAPILKWLNIASVAMLIGSLVLQPVVGASSCPCSQDSLADCCVEGACDSDCCCFGGAATASSSETSCCVASGNHFSSCEQFDCCQCGEPARPIAPTSSVIQVDVELLLQSVACDTDVPKPRVSIPETNGFDAHSCLQTNLQRQASLCVWLI